MTEAVANTVKFTGLTFDEVTPLASSVPAAYMNVPLAGTVTASWDAAAHALGVIEVRD